MQDTTKSNGEPLNTKEQASVLCNKTFQSGQTDVMYSKVVDANIDAQAVKVDDFNFEDVLEDEPEYTFVQDIFECDKYSVVVCDLQG